MNGKRAPFLCAAVSLVVFLPFSIPCGFSQDDYAFLNMLAGADARTFWEHFTTYVPGRNLQIAFFYLLFALTGAKAWALHLACSLIGALNAGLACALALRLAPVPVALPAALMYALLPHHGETHYWITQTVQSGVCMSWLLGAFLLAARGSAWAFLPYCVALFTYDQAFFLWPLLLVLWARRAQPSRAALAASGAGVLALNAAHVLLRHFSPISAGGRPVIHLGAVGERFVGSLRAALKGLFGLPSRGALPHWGWTVLLAAAALAGVWLFWRRWRALDRGKLDAWLASPAPLRLGLFGAAWFLLAFLPNYFWYLSPRHNHIPSFGLALILSTIIARRRGLALLALPVAATWIVADLHEGSEWARSARIHAAYIDEARRLSPPPKALFAYGAPRALGRAPVFNLYHDAVLSAEWTLGWSGLAGDYHFIPGRNGLIHHNDLSVNERSSFQWTPYSEAGILVYQPDGTFRCAGKLRVGAREIPLRRECDHVLEIEPDVALLSVRAAPVASGGIRVPGLPLRLAAARASQKEGVLILELDWSAEGRLPDLALIPNIVSPSGKVLFDPIYPARVPHKKRWPVLWPFYDDELPSSRWTGGVQERWAVRWGRALIASPLNLELSIYMLRSDKKSITEPAESATTLRPIRIMISE